MSRILTQVDQAGVSSSAQKRGRGMLDSIQYLRGIAAVMVVIYHSFPQMQRMGLVVTSPSALASGVDIFFVISGFVMIYTTSRHPDRGGIAFIRDRIMRIVPLYWVLSLIMLVLLLVVPAIAQTSRFDLAHVIASFLFIPWMHPVLHKYWPMLVPGWTLNYEMFFYLIFAVALAITGGRRALMVVICCATLIILTLVPLFVNVRGAAEFYCRSQVLEFAYGMVLGELFLRSRDMTSALWWIPVIVGALGLAISQWSDQYAPEALATGIPALLVVLGALYIPLDLTGWGERAARLVGDASYSIYLSHYMIMSALGQIWRKLVHGGLAGWIGFGFFATICCIVVGIMIFHLVEKPLNILAKRLLANASTAPSPSVHP